MMNGHFTATVALMGTSDGDAEVLTHAESTLRELAIPVGWLMATMGTPRWTGRHDGQAAVLAQQISQSGVRLAIVAAGSDVTLPSRLAELVDVPVLAVPCAKGPSEGLDRLRGLASMRVINNGAFLGLGKAGAINAALFAARILARSDAAVARAIERRRAQQEASVLTHKVVTAE